MRLSDFILRNMEPILQAWEDFARTIGPVTGTMDVLALRDHAEEMLRTIASDLRTRQTEQESLDKSWGMGPRGEADTPAETHAEGRLLSGFTIDQLISEYRALRASVLSLWSRQNAEADVVRFEVRDITRFNEAVDQALAESVRRYAHMVRERQDVFVGILGHDLRSPLQTIALGAEYLARSPESNTRQAQLGERMSRSCDRMCEMLDRLLDFARIRIEGTMPISRARVDMERVSRPVVEELRLSHPERTIHAEYEGDVSGAWDPGRIGQIYQNLIGNALQHGDGDGEVSVRTAGTAGDVVVTVHNHGEPIPEDQLDQIFELLRHRRTHPDGNNRAADRNLGLGLYITREIVVAHKGSISVSSSRDEGTTFTVRLPKHVDA